MWPALGLHSALAGHETEKFDIINWFHHRLACENIRFSSLFADGDEERGEADVFAG